MAGRPLRPATDRRHGRPLPHHLANPPQSPPLAPLTFIKSFPLLPVQKNLCGISSSFEELFPTRGQVNYVLLTRPPLSFRRKTVRLACVKHAASVCPEPGSNSPNKNFAEICHTDFHYLRLEELTYVSRFIITFQLLMCRFGKRRPVVSAHRRHNTDN